jgi:hypothetical protein
MAMVGGVDPGSSGAFAVYCTETRKIVFIEDMPIWYQRVGRKNRKRVDLLGVAKIYETFDLLGVQLVGIEEVGARPKDGGVSAFMFGYSTALVYSGAFYSGIPIENVLPAFWKQQLNVPGKSQADGTAIIKRADELFPENRDDFRGPKGGKRVDRAEAAMIAKLCGDLLLGTMDVTQPLDEVMRKAGLGE